MTRYFRALSYAVGVRRFVVGSAVAIAVALYGYLRSWLVLRGFSFLPELPTWQLYIIVILIFLGWWLLRRVVELEKEIEPQLEIVFRPGRPFEITEPMNTQGQATRLFRVQVVNKSVKNIDGCLVKLEEIRRVDQPEFVNRFTPVELITQDQLLQNREGGVFSLRGKEQTLVEVAFLNEKDPNAEIVLQYGNRGYPNGIPRGSYEITLKAYGGGVPVEGKFKLFVDDKGYLRLE